MIVTNPVGRIAHLVSLNPVRLMPVLNDLLPKNHWSNRRDKQAKVIANLPKPDILRILAALEREHSSHYDGDPVDRLIEQLEAKAGSLS